MLVEGSLPRRSRAWERLRSSSWRVCSRWTPPKRCRLGDLGGNETVGSCCLGGEDPGDLPHQGIGLSDQTWVRTLRQVLPGPVVFCGVRGLGLNAGPQVESSEVRFLVPDEGYLGHLCCWLHRPGDQAGRGLWWNSNAERQRDAEGPVKHETVATLRRPVLQEKRRETRRDRRTGLVSPHFDRDPRPRAGLGAREGAWRFGGIWEVTFCFFFVEKPPQVFVKIIPTFFFDLG